jgi:hypothetical protein
LHGRLHLETDSAGTYLEPDIESVVIRLERANIATIV